MNHVSESNLANKRSPMWVRGKAVIVGRWDVMIGDIGSRLRKSP